MCVFKENLSELDITHRILRYTNYLVAMVNKNVLPFKLDVPIFGNMVFLTKGLQSNLEFLLFWGPWSPFKNRWHLSDLYKRLENRNKAIEQLQNQMLYLGLANLLLSPIFLIWQTMNFFYNYTEIIKREPGVLGMRRWSHYGELYLRHFNELYHCMKARLNKGYNNFTE